MIAVFTKEEGGVYTNKSLLDAKSLEECFENSAKVVKLPKEPSKTYLQPAYYRELLLRIQRYIFDADYVWIGSDMLGTLEYHLILGMIFASGIEYGRVLIDNKEQQKLIHKFSGPGVGIEYIEKVVISKEEWKDSIRLEESIEFLRSKDVRNVVLKDLSIEDPDVQILLGYLYYSGLNTDPGTLSGHELAKVIFGR